MHHDARVRRLLCADARAACGAVMEETPDLKSAAFLPERFWPPVAQRRRVAAELCGPDSAVWGGKRQSAEPQAAECTNVWWCGARTRQGAAAIPGQWPGGRCLCVQAAAWRVLVRAL